MLQVAPDAQQPPVNPRVQGLQSPVQHLGEAGDLRHVGHGEAGLSQDPGRPTRGDEFHVKAYQSGGEGDQAGFIRDAQERTAHTCHLLSSSSSVSRHRVQEDRPRCARSATRSGAEAVRSGDSQTGFQE